MKKRFIYVIFTLVICFGLSLNAFAATIDGLEINFEPSKEDYKVSDRVDGTLTVTNRNDSDVTGIVVENYIPEGYSASDEASLSKTVEKLAPGEFFSVAVSLDSLTEDKDNTLLIIKIVVYSILALAVAGSLITVTVIIVKAAKSRSKQLVSFLLCVGMLAAMAVPARAEEQESAADRRSSVTLRHIVSVDGKDLLIEGLLSYDKIEGENENLIIDLGEMLYDVKSDTYYQIAKMNKLSGTLLYTEDAVSAHCTVSDINGNILLEKDFEPENMWYVDDFALIVGVNEVDVAVTYGSGAVYETEFYINNVCKENMDTLAVDEGDDDGDGVLNFIENMYGTDKAKADTDDDGLDDYYEMAVFGTSPTNPDTDGDGIIDSNEDADGDKFTNIEEITKYKTDPIAVDSDGDGLSDYDEINTYATEPTEADSDGDGASDGWEIKNNLDPKVFDENLPGSEDAVIPDDVLVESEGKVTVVEMQDDYLVNEDTPGYIGSKPIKVQIEAGHSASIKMGYNREMLAEGEVPSLYYFNEETQCYETVESTVDDEGNVVADIDKSGVYVLLNHKLAEDVITNEIFKPSDTNSDGPIDIVFVIDRSNSMVQNDPNDVRKLVTKEFINKLRDGLDKAAVVQFNNIGEIIMPLTDDKEALRNAVDSIVNSDGGGCSGTDENAGTNGSAGIRAALTALEGSTTMYKYIIFLTDGVDTSVSEDYGDEAGTVGITGEARGKGIVIHTVGLIGTGEVDVDLLKKVAKGTGGNYYVATVGENPENNSELVEIYKDIESVTVDRHLDSNNDGISDYYTKLICDDKLKTGTGVDKLFGDVSYDEIQKNADYDGDGLFNGEELIIIENDNGVFVKVVSLPTKADSDGDGLGDVLELDAGTSPIKKNGSVDTDDISWLVNSSNFMSNAYLELYNNSVLERGAVLVGNAFFGTTLNQTTLYRQMLLDYFVSVDKRLTEAEMIKVYSQIAEELVNASFDEILNDMLECVKSGDEAQFLNIINGAYEFLKSMQTFFSFASPTADLTNFDQALAQLHELNFTDWSYRDCEYWAFVSKDIVNNVGKDVSSESVDKALSFINENLDKQGIYQAQKGVVGGTVKISSKAFNSFTKAVDVTGKVMMVLEWGQKIGTAHVQYAEMVAAMQTIKDNAYVLESIMAASDNVYLTAAARDIKFYIDESYSQQEREFQMKIEQSESVATGIALDVIHEMIISKAGLPGLIIELVRSFGNAVFNMDEMSKNAAETVALAASADILAKNYSAHLNGGYAETYNEIWIAYADYSSKLYISMLNLIEMRRFAENKMDAWQNDKAVSDACADNADKCDDLSDEYNKKYYAFVVS